MNLTGPASCGFFIGENNMVMPLIDQLPPAPSPGDVEDVFDDKAYDFAAAMERFGEQANTLALAVESEAGRSKTEADRSQSQVSAATTEANRSKAEADRAKSEASQAQQAADDAVAVTTGGAASIDPAAGKIPIAGAEAAIKQAWIKDLEFELDRLRVATNKALYGDGPYPVLDFQFAGAGYLSPRIEFKRGSSATYVNAEGIITEAAADVPRFDYDPWTLEPLGLLVEKLSTNLVTNSENIYVGGATSDTDPSVLNVRGLPARRLTLNGEERIYSTSSMEIPLGEIGSITPCAQSWFIRRNETDPININIVYSAVSAGKQVYFTAVFDLATKEFVSVVNNSSALYVAHRFGYKLLKNGWIRVWVSVDISRDANLEHVRVSGQLFNGRTQTWTAKGETVYIDGWQAEIRRFPSSYIPTKGSTVTRAGDDVRIPNGWALPEFNAEKGTWAIEASTQDPTNNLRLIDRSTGKNGVSMLLAANPPGNLSVLLSGALHAVSFRDVNGVGRSKSAKIAISYSEDWVEGYVDGILAGNGRGLGSKLGTVGDILIGVSSITTERQLDGHIKSLSYYNTPLDSAALKKLTNTSE